MATAGIAALEAVDLAAAAEQYVTQGFVLVKNLITNDEAAAYRTESHRLLTALGGQDDPVPQRHPQAPRCSGDATHVRTHAERDGDAICLQASDRVRWLRSTRGLDARQVRWLDAPSNIWAEMWRDS
jgi:hypothetical protein